VVTVHEELELKYDVAGDAELPGLLSALRAGGTVDEADGLREGDGGDHELEAVYFDTADLRLAAAKATLRRRSGGTDEGWHLKLPGTDGARREHHVPLGRAVRTVPVALRRLVEEVTAGAALVPVARLSTRRSLQHLLDDGGRVLLERADDRVEGLRLLPSPTGEASAPLSWREVEVEVVEGDRALLEAVDAGLRAAGVRPSASSSKVSRVLTGTPAPAEPEPEPEAETEPEVLPAEADPTGPGQPEPTEPEAAEPPAALARPRWSAAGGRLELSERSSAGDVLLAHLGEQVDQVLDQDPHVRADVPDSVHRMRVATRRLRSALTTFSPLFASSTRPLRGELTWLAAELGAARDAEVLRERLAGAVAGLDAPRSDAPRSEVPQADADSPVAQEVTRQLDGAYRDAHDELLRALSSERYERLLDDLQGLLEAPGLAKRARRRAGKVLPRRVARTHRDLAALVHRAADAGRGEERDLLLHEARKAAKRVRYAAEAVTSVFGKDAKRFARAVTQLQEVLGEHQDSVVTRERLRELAQGDVSPALAFACGRLFEQERGRAAAGEEDVADAWKAVQAERLHRWLR